MRILVENSSWNNIGDGFYQFSLFYLLKKMFPQRQVAFLNAPTSRSFRVSQRFATNVFDPELIQDGELYILSGPILNSTFVRDYGRLIRGLTARGARYALISVHGGADSKPELARFFAQHPPVILASRDRATYEVYQDSAFPTYDGVCTASLVSLTCEVGDIIADKPYVAASFYAGYEPPFTVSEDATGNVSEVDGVQGWQPAKHWGVRRHFEFLTRKYPVSVGRYEIVRPVHDIAYKFSHLNFARSNSLLSYNPLVYLSIYKGASLTVTNRLHAALPTLSYGRPVVYVGKTARNGALDRLGLEGYQGKLTRCEPSVIAREYDGLVAALRRAGLE
jgi:Polysaccharide pyruvyl transferase